MSGNLCTKAVVLAVRRMGGGNEVQVTNERLVSVYSKISGPVLYRLKKLGWVEVRREWAFGNVYRTYAKLNEEGERRSVEFAAIADANA